MTAHSHENWDHTANYALLGYRQTLLRVLLLICIILTIAYTFLNLYEFVGNPALEWGARNLLSDGFTLIAFLLLWRLNNQGHISVVGWIFGLVILALIPETYSLSTLNNAFLIIALPVAISSFIIQPWASFMFVAFSTAFYTLVYFKNNKAFEYDIFSVGVLIVLGFGAYTVATLLNNTIRDIVHAYDQTIQGWALALEMRDSETSGHSKRVVELTLQLAKKFGIPDTELVHIRRGVLVHDLGKMAIPDAILYKAGNLTEEEWSIMRKHPEYAREYLSQIPFLAPALSIPYSHHEKWDGTGYPQRLKGEEIPLPARIFCIVDVWDALTSDRPYRKSWSEIESLDYIQDQAGKHFDPRVVRAFVDLIISQKPYLDSTVRSG